MDVMKNEIKKCWYRQKIIEEKDTELTDRESESTEREKSIKEYRKRPQLSKLPKGTEEVKDLQIQMGMKKWRILGDNAKATKMMQQNIESTACMKKRADCIL